jgi:hypothetical protein
MVLNEYLNNDNLFVQQEEHSHHLMELLKDHRITKKTKIFDKKQEINKQTLLNILRKLNFLSRSIFNESHCFTWNFFLSLVAFKIVQLIYDEV